MAKIYFGDDYWEEDLLDAQLGSASSAALPFDLPKEEAKEYLRELREREKKKIRPGFYKGTESRGR